MKYNKRELVQKALNNEVTDILPCSVWRHPSEDLTTGNQVIQDQLYYYRTTDVDFLKIMSDGYFPYFLDREVTEASQWRQLEPLADEHPYFTEQIERVRCIVKEVGQECMTYYNVFAPFSSIRFAAGNDVVMRHLKEDEEAVLHALDVIAFDNGRLCKRIIQEAGCDGIYFCVQGGEKSRFSHEKYMRLIAPSDLKVLNQANEYSEWNILHCCGWDGIKNNLENWKEYPCRAVNWSVHVEGMDLLEGKEFFGGKAVLGGFRNTKKGVISCGTPEEIRCKARNMQTKYQGIPGIILGADCSFDRDIRLENIANLMETLHHPAHKRICP